MHDGSLPNSVCSSLCDHWVATNVNLTCICSVVKMKTTKFCTQLVKWLRQMMQATTALMASCHPICVTCCSVLPNDSPPKSFLLHNHKLKSQLDGLVAVLKSCHCVCLLVRLCDDWEHKKCISKQNWRMAVINEDKSECMDFGWRRQLIGLSVLKDWEWKLFIGKTVLWQFTVTEMCFLRWNDPPFTRT